MSLATCSLDRMFSEKTLSLFRLKQLYRAIKHVQNPHIIYISNFNTTINYPWSINIVNAFLHQKWDSFSSNLEDLLSEFPYLGSKWRNHWHRKWIYVRGLLGIVMEPACFVIRSVIGVNHVCSLFSAVFIILWERHAELIINCLLCKSSLVNYIKTIAHIISFW